MTCFWDETLKGLSNFPEFNLKVSKSKFIEFCQTNCDIMLQRYKYVIWEGFDINNRDKSESGIDINKPNISSITLQVKTDIFKFIV